MLDAEIMENEKNLKFWLKKAQNIGFSGQNTLLEVHLSVQV